MQVRAKQKGYYDHRIRNEGDVFTLKPYETKNGEGKTIVVSPEKQFSAKWMTKHDTKSGPREFGKKTAANVTRPANEPSEPAEPSNDGDVI